MTKYLFINDYIEGEKYFATAFKMLILICFYFFGLINLTCLFPGEIRPEYLYMQNDTIRLIYIFAVLLDFIIVVIIALQYYPSFSLRTKKWLKIITVVLCLISIFFIHFEIYYGSTFYYGEIRDKQGIISFNNLGYIGSFIICLYLGAILYFSKINKIIFKVIYIISILFFDIVIHLVFYNIVKALWNLNCC